ncbi:hypothetical protein J6590_025765 [Homalodisca vitripennis]|nr:hypothetical protein J6590_025765 [Homalodisca vitripennis]
MCDHPQTISMPSQEYVVTSKFPPKTGRLVGDPGMVFLYPPGNPLTNPTYVTETMPELQWSLIISGCGTSGVKSSLFHHASSQGSLRQPSCLFQNESYECIDGIPIGHTIPKCSVSHHSCYTLLLDHHSLEKTDGLEIDQPREFVLAASGSPLFPAETGKAQSAGRCTSTKWYPLSINRLHVNNQLTGLHS